MEKHIVIGAKGGAGYGVVKALQALHLPYATLQRTPGAPGSASLQADLLDAQGMASACTEATHLYLCAGLPYEATVWQAQWPIVINNLITAAAAHHAKIIFLDNMYMYGPAPMPVPFDESTPQEAFTKKGKVRRDVANALLEAAAAGKVKAVIGRAADFYGPAATNSHFYFSFLERMLLGRPPQTLLKKGVVHTYAYTLDMGRAMVTLALDDTNSGEVFHLPTGEPITIEAVTAIFSEKLGKDFKPSYLPAWLFPLLSLFIKPIAEIKEMMYQFEEPYIMSWDKFRKRYPQIISTSYEDGIEEMIAYFKTNSTALPR